LSLLAENFKLWPLVEFALNSLLGGQVM